MDNEIIENNNDYISEYSLKEMLIELFDLNEDNVEIDEYIENDRDDTRTAHRLP